ncbi:MAG: substrate-binding domain-containing protein, partial [Janthinobacterium lividum]
MKAMFAAATLVGSLGLAFSPPADAKTIKIGISMLTQNAPYYAALQSAIEKEAKALGATTIAADANNDLVKQIADV